MATALNEVVDDPARYEEILAVYDLASSSITRRSMEMAPPKLNNDRRTITPPSHQLSNVASPEQTQRIGMELAELEKR